MKRFVELVESGQIGLPLPLLPVRPDEVSVEVFGILSRTTDTVLLKWDAGLFQPKEYIHSCRRNQFALTL